VRQDDKPLLINKCFMLRVSLTQKTATNDVALSLTMPNLPEDRS